MIRTIYENALGVGKLTADGLPGFPADETAWPLRPGTEIRLTRFHWDRPHTDPHNWKNILIISKEVKDNGAQHVPAAATAIHHVSEEDRQNRVVQKFKDMAKAVRLLAVGVTVVAVAVNGGDVEEGNGEGNGRNLTVNSHVPLTKSARQTRAKGVSYSTRSLCIHAI